jgi:curved DNA-binding protein
MRQQPSNFSENFSNFFESMYDHIERGRSREIKYRGQDLNAGLQFLLNKVYKTQSHTLTIKNKNIRERSI